MKRFIALFLSFSIMLSTFAPVVYAAETEAPADTAETVYPAESEQQPDELLEDTASENTLDSVNSETDCTDNAEILPEDGTAGGADCAEQQETAAEQDVIIDPGFNPMAYPGHDDYFTSEAQQAELEAEISRVIDSLDIEGKTDYQIIKAIYDYICDNVTYDYDNLDNSSYMLKYTAYAALINGTAVCNGYALAMCRLLDKAGIKNEFISGTGNGGGHAWNIVCLDGLWYCLDSTWDAGQKMNYGYRYFLKPYSDFGDHQPDSEYNTSSWNTAHPMAREAYTPSAAEKNVLATGVLGDNVTYTLYDDYSMYIDGTGPMYDYQREESPLYAHKFTVKTVDMAEGITHIGDYLFYNNYSLSNGNMLEQINIADSVTSVGNYAFMRMQGSYKIKLPSQLCTIGKYAFSGADFSGTLVLPETVTYMDVNAFSGCNVTDIVLPSAMTTLNYGAVSGLDITKLDIPDTVKIIESNAIMYCDRLTHITIPASVECIGNIYAGRSQAFWSAEQMETIDVAEANQYYKTVDNMLYDKTGETLHMVMPAREGILSIPEGTKTLAYGAVKGIKGITQIVLPASVEFIGIYSLHDCTSVTDVYYCGTEEEWAAIQNDYPEYNNVLQTAQIHFNYNNNFTVTVNPAENGTVYVDKTEVSKGNTVTVTAVPDQWYEVKEILLDGVKTEETTFMVTGNHTVEVIFEKVTYPHGSCGTDAYWKLIDGNLTIFGSGSMTNYSYSSNVPWNSYTDDIVSATVEHGITSIADNAFYDCENLKSVTIADTVKTIGKNVFYLCLNLQAVEIPYGVETIGDNTFGACGVKEVIFPDSVRTMGRMMFFANYRIEKVVFSKNTESYGDMFFSNCSSLKEVTLQGSFTDLVSRTFDSCSNLETIVIPDNVKVIKTGALNGCFRLKEVTLPAGLEQIENSVFRGIDSLTNVYFNGTETQWNEISKGDYNESLDDAAVVCSGGVAEGRCNENINWLITNSGQLVLTGSGDMPDYTARQTPWSAYADRITYVVINEEITSVGGAAFADLTKLKKVCIPASVVTIGKNAFLNCNSVTDIDYSGKKAQWEDIAVEEGNDVLYDAYIFYGDMVIAGKCGDNINYVLYEDGNLILTGSGKMYDYNVYDETDMPWYGYFDRIHRINIGEGITSVGDGAFGSRSYWGRLAYVTEVSLPSTLQTIGDYAFSMNGVNRLTIPEGVTSIGRNAFEFSFGIEEIRLPSTLKSIGEKAFDHCENLKNVYYSGTETQWDKIGYRPAANEFTDTVFHFRPEVKSITVSDDEGNPVKDKTLHIYPQPEKLIFTLGFTGNGEYSRNVDIRVEDDTVAEIVFDEISGTYSVIPLQEGSTKVTVTSVMTPQTDTVFTIKVIKMADDVDLTVKLNKDFNGESYILTTGQTFNVTAEWIGGEKWENYCFAVNGTGLEINGNEQSGKFKATSRGSGNIVITAQSPAGEKMEKTVPYTVYSEKTSSVVLSNTKAVLDPLKQITEITITARPSNTGAAAEFIFTKSSNDNYILTQETADTARIRILNGTAGNVTITAKATDGSNKSAKCTVSNGVVTEDIVLPYEELTIAKGKTAKVTATVMPANATVKTLSWISDNEDVATVKNGSIKAVNTGQTVITVSTQDGRNISKEIRVTVKNPAVYVKLNNGEKTITEYISDTPLIISNTVNVTDEHKSTEGISQSVKWAVSGANAKNVTDLGDGSFKVERPGKFTVTATATDGTNKKASVTYNILQQPAGIEVNPPKNTGWYEENGMQVWTVYTGSTVTPQVKYLPENTSKEFKKYIIDTKANTFLTTNASFTNVRSTVPGEYPVTVRTADGRFEQDIILKVIAKNSVDIAQLDFTFPDSVADITAVSAGTQLQLKAVMNGLNKLTGVNAVWSVAGEGAATVTQNGKLDLRQAQQGDEYTIRLTVTDKNNPQNSDYIEKNIKVTAKPQKADIDLVTADGVSVTKTEFTPAHPEIHFDIVTTQGAADNYTLSCTGKVISVTGNCYDGYTFKAVGKGTETITLTANDGSGVKQVFKVKSGTVTNPVKSISTVKKLAVNCSQPVEIDYEVIAAKSGLPSVSEILWTTNNPSVVCFENGAAELLTHSATGTVAFYPSAKSGKATITGTACDGSKKTVKITVETVPAAQGVMAQEITLRTPANTPNGGVNGLALLTWGKSIQLYTGFNPPANRNKTCTYTMEAVDKNGMPTGEQLTGITLKNGRISAAKYSSKLTPYTGFVKVSAAMEYRIYDESTDTFNSVKAGQIIYVQQPVTRMTIAKDGAAVKTAVVSKGGTVPFEAQVFYADESTSVAYPDLIWSVTNTSYATVDSAGNLTVKPYAPEGKTFKLRAVAQDGSGKKAEITIKIS